MLHWILLLGQINVIVVKSHTVALNHYGMKQLNHITSHKNEVVNSNSLYSHSLHYLVMFINSLPFIIITFPFVYSIANHSFVWLTISTGVAITVAVSPSSRGTVTLCLHRNPCFIGKSYEREGWLMSDFEILSIVLMVLTIVVTILLAYIQDTKK